MRGLALVLGCGVLACGPRVGMGADDETANDGTTGDAPVVTTAEPVTTSTDTGSDEEPEPPEPVPPLCFEQRLVWEVEGSATVHLADSLGNGVPELWLVMHGSSIFAHGLAAVTDTYEPYASVVFDHTVIAWSDLNGNGRDDALGYVIADEGLEWRVTLSDAAGVPSIPAPLEIDLPQTQGSSVAFFDATHDARADLFTSEDGLLRILRGDGTGAFSQWTNAPLEPWRAAVLLRPSRFDPRAFTAMLLPLADLQAAVALFAIAPGGALVRYATTPPIEGHPIPIDMRPIDADERPDVAVQHGADATVITIYLASDDGQLEDAWQSPEADAAAVGDFDGDGWLDIIWSRGGQSYALGALPSAQDGVPVEVDLAPAHPHLVADLDGDGREEIVQLRELADSFALEVIAAIDCP